MRDGGQGTGLAGAVDLWGADVFTLAAVGMALIDLDGIYQRVNDRFCEIVGRSPDEVLGRHTTDLSYPEDVAMGRAVVAAMAGGRLDAHQAVKRFWRPDGTVVHVLRLTRLVRTPEGAPGYLFAQYVDLTRQVTRTDGLVQLGRLALDDPPPETLRTAAVELVARSLGVPAAHAVQLVERPETMRCRPDSDDGDIALVATDADFVEHVAQVLASEAQRREAKARLEYAAGHDLMTGLTNRASFEQALAHQPGPVGLLILDLDSFKDVNDTWGHAAGDELLRVVAARLRHAVRPEDAVARLGGDEFAVLTAAAVPAAAEALAHRLLDVLGTPVALPHCVVTVSASVGVAWSGSTVSAPDRLLADADLALYAAKGAGRGCVEVYQPELRDEVETRMATDRRVVKAVEDGSLEVHYQPVVRLADGVAVGLESLLRWDTTDPAPLSPAQILAAAERTGRLAELGRVTLRRTLADLDAWARAAPYAPPIRVSVNLAADQLADRATLGVLLDARRQGRIAARQVYVEVTESAMFPSLDEAVRVLTMLRQAGIGVALDDFGTGYSSLSHLVHLPVEALKLDATFTAGLASGDRQQAVLRAVVGLAHDLGLLVVAEGVETPAQAELFGRAGCGLGQGWLYAPALPAALIADSRTEEGRLVFPRRPPVP
jgi:diguanylate cyclase (GGDEF)-like protein/PAS domain S-box-containing protein